MFCATCCKNECATLVQSFGNFCLNALYGPFERVKGEVRRKMNFTYVLGFVVLKNVVKVFPVSSSSFARKTLGGIEHEVTWGHDAA